MKNLSETPFIVNPAIEEYLKNLLPARNPVLETMEKQAHTRQIPIVGPLVGRLFQQLAVIHKAKRVFEMGSAIGYSTLWWSMGVGKEGEVHYTDGSPRHVTEAEGFIKSAGMEKIVKFHTGNALDIIEQVSGEFDVIFCDIDKGDYPEAFHKAYPKLRVGGLLVADNVLWSGKVTESEGDNWTEAIKEFNQLLYTTPGLFTTIVPLRDGVSISVKLG